MVDQLFFINVTPDEQITLEQLFSMTFDCLEDAAIALAKVDFVNGGSVVFPPSSFNWNILPPPGEVFEEPPPEHHAELIEEEGRYRWKQVD
jgi:hypothetical protein